MVRLKTPYVSAQESDGSIDVCAIVEGRKSVTFSFDVTFTFMEDIASMCCSIPCIIVMATSL